MTDIAGLCERLRAITTTDHERLCQGREYVCSCGWDAENEAKATKAADTIERQAAEIERLRSAGRVTPRLRLVRNFLLAAAAVALPIIGLVEMLLPG